MLLAIVKVKVFVEREYFTLIPYPYSVIFSCRCLVKVNEGAASLSPKDPTESLITKGRPVTWRAACRCVVGADNTPATINIDLTPQSQFSDELAPPVKSVLRNDE